MENYEKKRKTYINAIQKLADKYDLIIHQIQPFDSAPVNDALGVIGDWNSPELAWLEEIISRYERKYQVFIKWDDQTGICDCCGRLCDLYPSFYGAELSYILIRDNSCELVCRSCFVLENYLDYFVNNHHSCVPSWALDQAKQLGFELLEETYENGLHEGMNDNPESILKTLQEKFPEKDFMFFLKETSQFYITFNVLARDKDNEEQDEQDEQDEKEEEMWEDENGY